MALKGGQSSTVGMAANKNRNKKRKATKKARLVALKGSHSSAVDMAAKQIKRKATYRPLTRSQTNSLKKLSQRQADAKVMQHLYLPQAQAAAGCSQVWLLQQARQDHSVLTEAL